MLPWINTTALDQRRAFIVAYLTGDDSIADLARRFRVSRKTAHKFINRYERLGDVGLHDLPRAPHNNPRATDPDLAAMIVEAKQANPILGPKKIIPNLRDDHPDLHWPAPTRGKRQSSTARDSSSAASARAAPRPTATPSPTPTPPTTAGPSTSRAGRGPATASASTRSRSSTPTPASSSLARDSRAQPSPTFSPSWSAPSKSAGSPPPYAPTTARPSPPPDSAASPPSPSTSSNWA